MANLHCVSIEMFWFKLFFIFVANCSFIHLIYTINIAKQINGNVQLMGKGTIELIVSDVLSFTVTKSCQGKLILCYAAKRKLTNGRNELDSFENKCLPNNCILKLDLQDLARSTVITSKLQQDSIIVTFNKNLPFVCQLDTTKNRQSITVLELPNCDVVINVVVLLADDSKMNNLKGKQTSTESSVSEYSNNHKSNWFFVAVVCIVGCLFTIAGVTFLGYMEHRDANNKNTPKPSQRRHSIQDVSPTASQSSPTVSEKDEKFI